MARTQWYSPQKMPIVGLEVELTNMSQKNVSKYLHQLLGGYVVIEEKEYAGRNLQGESITWRVLVYKHKDTRIGSFYVELDENGTSGRALQQENAVVEVVTRPLVAETVTIFDHALLELQRLGAMGVDSGQPVAIQLNLQVGDGSRETIDVHKLIEFLRNYYMSSHRHILDNYFSVPEIRKKYIGEYSPEMMKRILDSNYKPTSAQFYEDFMYRQSMEILGDSKAWSMSVQDVRDRLKSKVTVSGVDVLLPVVKWNHVRISSLLMFLFPDEWMSKYLLQSKWVRALPIIEVREPNSDFRLLDYYQTLGGLFIKSFYEGAFVFLERENGILKRDIEKVLTLTGKSAGRSFVVRTMLYDGKSDPYADPLTKYYLSKYEKDLSTVIFLNGKDQPRAPYLVPGESVVFHNLPELSHIIMGKYNPAISNQYIGQFIEHKYYEYLFWNDYATGAMPKTISLLDIVSDGMTVTQIRQRLSELFPNGWVMKGVFESATQKQFIVTDNTEIEKELETYSRLHKEFQELRDKALIEMDGNNPDILARRIREHAAFYGWRLKRYIKNPMSAIVQERLSIEAEYRVEAIAGKVLGGESTIPRYQYETPENDDWRKQQEITRVEKYVQNIINQLPQFLRGTPFAFDVAVTSNGDLFLIESNPMSNSGFLIYDKRGIKALNKFLQNFPHFLRKGEVSVGVSGSDQMRFIKGFIRRHKLIVDNKYFPFLKAVDIEDTKNEDQSLKETTFSFSCREIFSVR